MDLGGLAVDAADQLTDQMVSAAGWMLIPAEPFPETAAIGKLMPVGKGGPGTMTKGAVEWLNGADALNRAHETLVELCQGLGHDRWDGDDRTLFDTKTQQLADQLQISAQYSQSVGAVLAGLTGPLAAYGPVCLTIGALLMDEGLAFEAAVASVVGNAGASEAAYAAGCATAGACLGVLIGMVAGIALAMEAAAAGIMIGTVAEVKDLTRHGDTSAASDFKQAEVKGAGEVLENLEKLGVDVASDFAGEKGAEGIEDKYLKHLVGGEIGTLFKNENSAVIDLAKGNYGDALKDLSGYKNQMDLVDDLFGEPEKEPDEGKLPDRNYSLPPATSPVPPSVPPSGPGPQDPGFPLPPQTGPQDPTPGGVPGPQDPGGGYPGPQDPGGGLPGPQDPGGGLPGPQDPGGGLPGPLDPGGIPGGGLDEPIPDAGPDDDQVIPASADINEGRPA